ncbi:hypothetical protein [Arthrobacter sp. KK5.5]|uniref:hypothetical protein n=1 Tax=Arthrobacter sp. KK5.5 TaxID=3373084 RepID=UPI003EE8126E
MGKFLATIAMTGLLLVGSAASAGAAPLPDDCTKTQGTVTCTTFEGPGNNQGGVGSTTTEETQGNTSNKNPRPQDLQEDCETNPENSQGAPNTCD